MMDDGPKDRDRNRFQAFEEPPPRVSLLNEPVVFRDYGDATWPRARPIHAVIAETLANVELLLAHLQSGVWAPDSQRPMVRDLFVQTLRQREVLTAALRLELE